MASNLFIAYLLYGFVYILFGYQVFSIQKQNLKDHRLVLSLFFVAGFGITHGISEWLTVLRLSGLFLEQDLLIQNTKVFLKLTSFLLLFQAGLSLLQKRAHYKSWMTGIPLVIGLTYTVIFFVIGVREGFDFLITDRQFNVIYIRYSAGFFGALCAAYGFYLESKTSSNEQLELQLTLKGMTGILIVYAFVDGLIVREAGFFPNTFINNAQFMALFGFPIQWLKIVIGLGFFCFSRLLLRRIVVYREYVLAQANIQAIEMDARCKVGYEIHDVVMQNLYGLKLKLRHLMKQHPELDLASNIEDVQQCLNDTRRFLNNENFQKMRWEDFSQKLRDLTQNLNLLNLADFRLHIQPSDFDHLKPSSIAWSHLYFSIQELVLNSFKHAQAKVIDVTIHTQDDVLKITVRDDGIGMQEQINGQHEGYGLTSIDQRLKQLNGTLAIETPSKGSAIRLEVPLEVIAS